MLRYKKRYLLRIIIPAYPRFNVYSSIANKTTALGPLYVATSAKEVNGWEVEVIDENNFYNSRLKTRLGKINHKLIQNQRPADVVGFYGGLTCTIPRIYTLARFYKQQGVITIAGGQHFVEETIPEALSSGIDYIIRGEGEITIKKLLSVLSNAENLSSIPGIVFKKKDEIIFTGQQIPIQNLDDLPLPDFSLLKYTKIKLFPVGRVRGCGMNCEFCAVKGRPRYASSQKLINQIDNLVKEMKAKEFFIVDDLFGQDRKETLNLCKMLAEYQRSKKIQLRFTVQIRLDKAKDVELLKAMREANIRVVTIGFESPIDEELKVMNKSLCSKDMLELARIFHKFGFFIHGMFIFGYPMKEKINFIMPVEERIKYFERFIKKAKLDTIQVVLPIPLPGTELRERLISKKRVFPLSIVGWQYYDGTFPLFKPDYPLTPQKMQLAMREIMEHFYNIKYLFIFPLNLFSIISLPFYFNNFKSGWRSWCRRTRNYIFRIIGQRIIKMWTAQLYKEVFLKKLQKAENNISTIN